MSQLFYGSINLSKLIEEAKEKHSAFSKSAKNGNIYCNIQAWVNDEPDEYGNIVALKLSATKEHLAKDETAGKIYIGNLKEGEGSKALDSKDSKALESIADDLPY